MKQVEQYPPDYSLILRVLEPKPGTIFTFGDIIYNPDGVEISRELEIHEGTHMVQQGADPGAWWARYLIDPAFRLEQEMQAYQNQYKAYCERETSRENRAKYLMQIAWDASSPMYGKMIEFAEAAKLIRGS